MRSGLIKIIFIIMFFACAALPVDRTAENFVMYSAEGKRMIFYDLCKTLPANGAVILNFTSVYCKPCAREIPELVKLSGLSEGKIMLVFIYAEVGNIVKENASEFKITDKAYVDPFGNIRKQYNVIKTPTTFVINTNYKILGRFDEYSEKNTKAIADIIAKQ